jgi:hypothetical protein
MHKLEPLASAASPQSCPADSDVPIDRCSCKGEGSGCARLFSACSPASLRRLTHRDHAITARRGFHSLSPFLRPVLGFLWCSIVLCLWRFYCFPTNESGTIAASDYTIQPPPFRRTPEDSLRFSQNFSLQLRGRQSKLEQQQAHTWRPRYKRRKAG